MFNFGACDWDASGSPPDPRLSWRSSLPSFFPFLWGVLMNLHGCRHFFQRQASGVSKRIAFKVDTGEGCVCRDVITMQSLVFGNGICSIFFPAGTYASRTWGTGSLGVKRTTNNWAVLRECGHQILQYYWFRAAVKL
eukprot:1141307-Pelagomonas_calceolata.AAC.8